jgi:hypothetical protein
MIGRPLRILTLTMTALIGCSQTDQTKAGEAPRNTPAVRRVSNADEATLMVSAAIRRHGLTSLPDQCLQYSVSTSNPDVFLVEVRENHRRPECKGDPQTAPHLFDVRVDGQSGAITTNAKSAPDAFRPLPPER